MEIDSRTLTRQDVRGLVKAYFLLTRQRNALAGQTAQTESEIASALGAWVATVPAASWANSIPGVIPAMAAGLAAHIDIETAPTAGAVWRFAGLDPTIAWRQGARRPWNPELRSICLRIGHGLAESAKLADGFYGGLYRQRVAIEKNNNQRRPDPAQLPPAQILARARRWTVKLFLAHYHHVAWTLATGSAPLKPYAYEILGNRGFIAPPNFPGGLR